MKIYTITDPEIATMLKNGAVGVIPSDTVYGIVACLYDKVAIGRVLKLKHRTEKPIGTVLAGNLGQLTPFLNSDLLPTVQQYWPGPVSIILPVAEELEYAHKNLRSLPFRIPHNVSLQKLVTATGLIATTSANLPGEQPVTTAQEAIELFKNKVDFYVDGGRLQNKRPSKIIKILSDKSIEVVREG